MRKDDPRKILSKPDAEFHPTCFESAAQYRDYVTLMRQAAEPFDSSYCLDCTPEYKSQMLAEGRCNHPETRFVIWSSNTQREPEIIGVSNKSKYWKRVSAGVTILNWGDDDKEDQ